MGDVQHELDHSGKMLARLAEEFRKPRISAILTGEAAQYQAIEDAFWQLLVERGVDTAVGNALDVLGRIVGEPRQGALDADYRLRVRARIRVNRSDGTIEDIIEVVRLLIGSVLARRMQVDRKTGYLISSGTAICGGSAIAAVGPVIKANDHEMSVSLGAVFILNAVALFLFPVLGHLLELTQQQFGMWAAIAIHDTSSVVGAGAAYGDEALKVATTVKLTRDLWIIPVAFVTSFI